jgi:hypothetical protein
MHNHRGTVGTPPRIRNLSTRIEASAQLDVAAAFRAGLGLKRRSGCGASPCHAVNEISVIMTTMSHYTE